MTAVQIAFTGPGGARFAAALAQRALEIQRLCRMRRACVFYPRAVHTCGSAQLDWIQPSGAV